MDEVQPLVVDCGRRPLDPRRTPYRRDIAADSLRDQVDAQRFVSGIPHQVRVGVCSMVDAPQSDAQQISQLLFGETFVVYDHHDHWAWGQNRTDDYVGYVTADALALVSSGRTATHWISALATFVYEAPDIKTSIRDRLSFTSAVTIVEETDRFAALQDGGWIIAQHITPYPIRWHDILTAARMFLGLLYLWGGRSSLGIDCSGLLQLCLASLGIYAPRDSDMLATEIGLPIDRTTSSLFSGDLIFFPGHCGIMVDSHTLLHATAFTMSVTCEPLCEVIKRVAPYTQDAITAIRRLDSVT